jgi:hypothetical protein
MRYFDSPKDNKISMSVTYRVSNITGNASINYLEYETLTSQKSYSAPAVYPKIGGIFFLEKEIEKTELLSANLNIDIVYLPKQNIYFKLTNVKILTTDDLKCNFVSYKEPITSSKEIFKASNGGEALHKGEVYSAYNDFWTWY